MSRGSLARAAASVLALAMLAGCGDHSSPVSPPPAVADLPAPAQPPVTLPSADYSLPAPNPGGHFPVLHRTSPLTSALTASGTIGTRGGLISLPGTGLYVYFPAGAVAKRTTFTVTANVGPFVTYTFEPHTIFQSPVVLIQDLSYTEAKGNPNLVTQVQGGYLANGDADIDGAGSGDFAQTFTAYVLNDDETSSYPTYAVFFTTHFSGYAYASGRASIDPSY